MGRREKQLERLAALEAELRERLLVDAEKAACDRNTLFFTTAEFNPFRLPERHLPAASAELAELAAEALQLAGALGEPEGAPVAAMFRRYLQRANDRADHHRPGDAAMAQGLIEELRALRS